MRRTLIALSCLIACFLCTSQAHAGTTLDTVRAAGKLSCGLDTEEPEYSLDDAHGNHAKFDLDVCKAIAVAVLGPNAKFDVIPNRDEADSLKSLRDGKTDVLATASPYIANSNGSFVFARPIFYDHQGIMVNTANGVQSVRDLAGQKICFLIGTEIERQLTAYMNREKIKFIPGPFSEEGEMEVAFVTGHCAAVTADVSQLGYERIAFKNMAPRFAILPQIVAMDPLAPAVRTDDLQWAAIVQWAMNALVQAEEFGVSQDNLAQMLNSEDEPTRCLLGSHKGWGTFLGLSDDWAMHEIEAVGNYGEIFDRNLGAKSPMRLERGLNNLYTHGGLMISEPIR